MLQRGQGRVGAYSLSLSTIGGSDRPPTSSLTLGRRCPGWCRHESRGGPSTSRAPKACPDAAQERDIGKDIIRTLALIDMVVYGSMAAWLHGCMTTWLQTMFGAHLGLVVVLHGLDRGSRSLANVTPGIIIRSSAHSSIGPFDRAFVPCTPYVSRQEYFTQP